MPLNSFKFLLFFLTVGVAYWMVPRRRQNLLLLAASYAFYCFWDYRFLALVLISTSVDFWAARRMADAENERRRRGYLWISLAVNLGILGFFKYFNFFLDGAVSILNACGWDAARWHLDLLLPIGISFYTFKTLSYTIGVYGREIEPTRRWVDYALFVAFFPQLLSGPIDRAASLLPQIEKDRTITRELVRTGCWLFFWGLFKKVVVADNLAEVVAPAFSPDLAVSTAYAWTALYAFALQLYCDFSGYTDMARGVASLLGFQTSINFRNPFFATNPVDYWQRWHISLSQWIQDYVYFPMAAQALRKGTTAWHQYWPHVCTMALIGLWHGANWTYVAFGLYWGAAIVLYNVWRGERKRRLKRAGRKPRAGAWPLFAPSRMVAMLAFFHVVCLGFIFFRSASLVEALRYFGVLFDLRAGGWLWNGFGLDSLNAWLLMGMLYAPVLIVQASQEVRGDLLAPLSWNPWFRAALCAVSGGMLLVLAKTSGGAFIYVQF